MKFNWLKRFVGRSGDPAGSAAAGGPRRVPSLAVGDTIGGEYRVLQVLAGGMGAVYVVHHHELDQPIVLKTLLGGADQESGRAFLREAQTWTTIPPHPNVVEAFWARELAGRLFVAAEFIQPDAQGRTSLRDFLRFGPLPLPLIMKWAAQFCHGMAHSYRHAVTAHRDIKPENLLVDPFGDLRITDFGLAKPSGVAHTAAAGQHVASSSLTRSGWGTPGYMAPEQLLMAGEPSASVDVYSFGVVLYELCTGRAPYAARTPEALNSLHLTAPVPSTGSALDEIILTCMAKTPEQRFPDPNALLAELTSLASNLGIPVPTPRVYRGAEEDKLYAQALSYTSLGRPDLAVKAIREYVKRRPDDYRGWTHLGRMMLEMGDVRGSLEATQRAIGLNPVNTHSWNNLGILYKRLDRPADAIGAFEEALAIDPHNTGAMLNQSLPLSQLGRQRDAIALLERALTVQPEKGTLRHNLGALYLELGEDERARECFRLALDLDPSLSQAREGLRRLGA